MPKMQGKCQDKGGKKMKREIMGKINAKLTLNELVKFSNETNTDIVINNGEPYVLFGYMEIN